MLDISPLLMVVIAIIFLAVVARLNSCLYQPLLKHMDSRDADIKEKLASLEQNSTEVKKYYDEANKILADAKQEASKIKQQAINEAMLLAQEKLQQAKQEIEKEYSVFQQTLNQEKEHLKATLVSNIGVFQKTLINKLKNI